MNAHPVSVITRGSSGNGETMSTNPKHRLDDGAGGRSDRLAPIQPKGWRLAKLGNGGRGLCQTVKSGGPAGKSAGNFGQYCRRSVAITPARYISCSLERSRSSKARAGRYPTAKMRRANTTTIVGAAMRRSVMRKRINNAHQNKKPTTA